MVMQTSNLCSTCNSGPQVTILESGEIICSNCGLVSQDKAVESRAEWRTFENNDRVRVEPPSSLAFHDMGLATIIGKTNKDSSGHKPIASMNSVMERLSTWEARSRSKIYLDIEI
jgi:transcription initiation factor TFIIB